MDALLASSYWPPALPDAASIGRQLDRLAYHAQQWSLRAPLATIRRVTVAFSPHAGEDSPDGPAITAFERRYQELLARRRAT